MNIYLERLELHGFKSFPEKTVIKFHKGITAVIGPNGCGKSNIVDALLWVLGEQKIKNLRGENSEDLIFNGSETTKPLGMTEVSAGFINSSEPLYVARRFFRTGESKYILNEKYCRHRDIQDVLFNLQLGGRGYFIFEQGSIEKMVSLKPSERRTLIEEAAGISQYLERKRETINKLIVAEQNLDNLEILTADKEKRLRDLKNQVNYVERYREYKKESVKVLSELLYRRSEYAQNRYKELTKSSRELLDQEQMVTKEVGAGEKEVVRFEEDRWKWDLQLKELQKRSFDINQQIMGCKNEKDKNRQFLEFAEQKKVSLKKRIEDNGFEIRQIEKKIEEVDIKLKIESENVEKERVRVLDNEEKLIDLKERVEESVKKEQLLKSDIFTAQSELTAARNRIRDIDRQMVRLENEEKNKKDLVEEIKQQLDESKEKSIKEELSDLEGVHKQEVAKLSEEKEKQKRKEVLKGDLKEELNGYRNEVDNLVRQKKKYSEIRERIVGKKKGVKCGTSIQEIVRGEKKFLKVLENFYFEEMEASVLENSERVSDYHDSKIVLPILKEGTLPESISSEPGFVSFVKDLYQLESGISQKSFLKNGVVVENLKDGVSIFNRYGVDIVTLDGVVLNSGGLITRNREKGILELNEELRRVGKDITRAETLREKTSDKLSKIIEDIKGTASLIESAEKENRGRDKRIVELGAELQALIKAKERSYQRIISAEKQLKLIAGNKEELQEAFDNQELLEEDKEKEYNLLVTQREDLGVVQKQLRDQESRIEKEYMEVESGIKLRQERLKSGKERLGALTSGMKRLNTEIQKASKELKDIDGQESVKAEEILLLENSLKSLETKKSLISKDLVSGEEKLSLINGHIRKETSDLNLKREVLDEVKNKKSHIDIELASVKSDLNRLEEESFRELNREIKEIGRPQEEDYKEATVEDLEKRNSFLGERLLRMRESDRMNFSAESEYQILMADYEGMVAQKEDVIKSIENLNDAVNRIDKESKEKFSAAFESIKDYFVKNFAILFEGGEAELILTDVENPLESGLEIKAQPPGKKLQSLRLLSGGEKTLTSLAFLFALFEYKPSPFCVFDEVDASLDEANIQRFLKFLHKLKDKTQFLIITHNFKTMEEADYIYGISMNEPGISTIYSAKMEKGVPVFEN